MIVDPTYVIAKDGQIIIIGPDNETSGEIPAKLAQKLVSDALLQQAVRRALQGKSQEKPHVDGNAGIASK